jgi:protease-4
MRILPFLASVPALALAATLLAQEPSAKPEAKAAEPAAAAKAGEPAAAPKKTKIPFLKPSGAWADLPEMGFNPASLLTGGGAPPKPFFKLLAAFDEVAGNADATTVLLDLTGDLQLNLAQLREVERKLAAVRQKGKRLVAYVESGGASEYQLAALCDKILLADMGALDLRSPALQVMHFKDAMDLLGVQADVTRVGEFKGAVEPFLLSEMSPHLKKHYEAMLTSMNQDVVRRIASGRKLAPERVRELQGKRLLLAKEALAEGLVDQIVPWEGGQRALARELGTEDIELVDAMPKQKQKSRDLFALLAEMFRGKKETEIEEPELVVLHLAGGIVDGDKAQPGSIVSGPAVKQIDALADNELVKGVVVRVNSPGGSATASEAVRRALERLAAKKPVVFSMGNVAGSGGYWITCIGRPIFAEVGTITGSIGVFGMHFQAGALMRRLGVRAETVALDTGVDFEAIDRPWSEAARARMQGFVDDVYERFIGNVASSRKLPPDEVRKIAGGRVWSGSQAADLKLIDQVGGVDDALAIVRKEANAGADVEVRHMPEPRNLADTLFESMFESQVLAPERTALAALLQRAGNADALLLLLRDLLAFDGKPRVYALLPLDLRVR